MRKVWKIIRLFTKLSGFVCLSVLLIILAADCYTNILAND